MRRLLWLSMRSVTVVCCAAQGTEATTVHHVSAASSCTAGCASCGTTWPTAFSTVQEAIDCAPTTGDVEIWVAEGTYGAVLLNAGHNPNLKLFGGFTGVETSASQSDPHRNRTFISGGGTQRAVTLIGNHARFRGFYFVDGFRGAPNYWDYGAAGYLTGSNALASSCVKLSVRKWLT